MNENLRKIIVGVDTFKKNQPAMYAFISKYINLYIIALAIGKTESNYDFKAVGYDGEIGLFQYLESTLNGLLNNYKKYFKDINKTKQLFMTNPESQAYIFCFSIYYYCKILENAKNKLNPDYEKSIAMFPVELQNYVRIGVIHNQGSATTRIATRFYPGLFYMNRISIVVNEIINIITGKQTIAGVDENLEKELMQKLEKIMPQIIGFSIPSVTAVNFKIIKPVLDNILVNGYKYIQLAKMTVKSLTGEKTFVPYDMLDPTIRQYLEMKIKDGVENANKKAAETETKTEPEKTETDTEKKEKQTEPEQKKNDTSINPLLPVGVGAGAGLYSLFSSVASNPILLAGLGVGGYLLLSEKTKRRKSKRS